MEIPFIIFIGIGILVLIVILNQASAKKANDAWQAAAAKLGLQFVPGSLFQVRRIEGQYRGQWVQVDTYTRSSGKNSKTYTRYEVSFPEDLGLGLRLSGQGFFSQVWTFLGGQDIHTGDAAFDEDVVVKGNDAGQVRRFLTASRRRKIYNLMQNLRGATIDDRKIHWSKGGVEKNAQNIFYTVDRMAELARDLYAAWDEEETPTEASLEQIPEVIPVQPVYEAPPPLPVAAALPEGPDAQPLPQSVGGMRKPSSQEGLQIRPTSKNDGLQIRPTTDEEAARVKTATAKESVAELPVDAVVETGADGNAEEDRLPPVLLPQERPSEPAETAGKLDLGIAAVCEALFHSDLMTHKVTEKFDESYKDKQIEWAGKLEFVSGYSFDMQFGNEPGAKATVDVYEIKETYGSNKAQAIVQFPAEMEKELRERQGGEISFSGKLIGCDGFMRRLFVADGRLSI